ncbi:MAG: efflux RND transporter permease subunit [Planctomycetota bacterium]|jgi:multidrug efflux pump subunit AcrB
MEDPRLTNRYSFIVTKWPGASAERVESLVTEPVERSLQSIKEIYKMISRSRAGVSVIQIELADNVPPSAVDEVWSRMRDRLADAALKLPEGASYPRFDNDDAESYTALIALVWDAQDFNIEKNHAILTRPAQRLEDRLRNLSGTEHTKRFGDSREEIHVDIEPQSLAQLGMTPEQLSGQITAADATVASGLLRTDTHDLLIEVSGELDQLERVRQIPLRFGRAGQFVRLGDLATVTKKATDPAPQIALVSGQPAVIIAARMTRNERIDLWMAGVHRILDDFKRELSPQVKARIIFDQSHYTYQRLGTLIGSFGLAIIAVCIVVFVMMGWRAAIIVCLTLPLTSLMVLMGLDLWNLPIHQMSIMGLVIALGLLIDNAIVMVDETNQRLRAGHEPHTAIQKAVKQLGVPLLGSTLTTVLAFMPIVLLPGAPGEFVGGIAVSVILALFSSLALALTLVPAVAAMLHKAHHGPSYAGVTIQALKAPYTQAIEFFLSRPVIGIMIALLLPAVGFVASSRLPEQFFPQADRDMFQVQLRLPRQASIHATRRIAEDARRLMLQNERILSVTWFIGDSAPMFYYNMNTGEDNSPHFAQAMVKLDHGDNLNQLAQSLQKQLNESFPIAESLVLPFQQGPPYDAPIELQIQGPDLDTLYRLGEEARGILAKTPGVVHARTTLAGGRPTLQIALDDDEARLAGLNNRSVAQQLDASLEGAVGSDLIEDVVAMPIRIRLAKASRDDLNEVASMSLYPDAQQTTLGLPIPLTALGKPHLTPQIASIERRSTQRTNTVLGFTTPGILPSRILDAYQKRLEASGFKLPAGYKFNWAGESGERDRAVGQLLASAVFLMVLMITSLVLSLGSFRQTALIALVALASVGLGLGALAAFGFAFGFIAIVGIMGLVGLAINDSIVVLAALNHNPKARKGDPHAIRDTVLKATRHVLATTITTMAGFLPLMLSGGAFWPPLAIVIGAGVAGATAFALVLVPAGFKMLTPLPVRSD